MPGLVPGIPRRILGIRPHAEPRQQNSKVHRSGAAWMAGTSPAMTRRGCTDAKYLTLCGHFSFPGQPYNRRRPRISARGFGMGCEVEDMHDALPDGLAVMGEQGRTGQAKPTQGSVSV